MLSQIVGEEDYNSICRRRQMSGRFQVMLLLEMVAEEDELQQIPQLSLFPVMVLLEIAADVTL